MKKGFIFIIMLSLSYVFSNEYQKANEEVWPKVTAIFPSSDTLPENLLRMYIQFSQPMRTSDNLEKIKLMDDQEQEVVGAIFNNMYELWDKEQKQLTLILDPSRVKTSLQVNEKMGRALQAGRRYKLVIGPLEDVEGQQLRETFSKSFYVDDEDRLSPNPALWTMQIPQANTQAPLIVKFPEMLDRLSMLQRIHLADKNNQPISGQVETAKQETEWRFVPTDKWSLNDYVLYVHGRLEDPCGNNLNGLFDHKIGSLRNEQEGVLESIPFIIE